MKACKITEDFASRQKNEAFALFTVIRLSADISWICRNVFQRSNHLSELLLNILQNSQENTCAKVSLFASRSLVRVFSCGFFKIFKKTFFTDHIWRTASRHLKYDIYSEVPRSFLFKLLHELLICFAVAPYLATFRTLCSSC